MDAADRMASFELSKNDELDRCQSFVREKEVLRMIWKWLDSPLAIHPCDSVDSRLSTMPSYASVDFVMPVKPSYDLAKSKPPPKPNYPAWKPIHTLPLHFHPPIWTRLMTLKSYLQHDTIPSGAVTHQWFFCHDLFSISYHHQTYLVMLPSMTFTYYSFVGDISSLQKFFWFPFFPGHYFQFILAILLSIYFQLFFLSYSFLCPRSRTPQVKLHDFIAATLCHSFISLSLRTLLNFLAWRLSFRFVPFLIPQADGE